MEANRINITGLNNSYGIYLYEDKNRTEYGGLPGILNNNEIIISGSGGEKYGIYGLYFFGSRWEISHNSIFIQASNSKNYGLYIDDKFTVMNNISVVCSGRENYPLYIYGSVNNLLPYFTSDYNNFVTPNGECFAYSVSAYPTLSAWQKATRQDAHSSSMMPAFSDSRNCLEPTNCFGLLCPKRSKIPNDIHGQKRDTLTTMGAYAYIPPLFAALTDFGKTEIKGEQSSKVEVTLYNCGKDTLTSATIQWAVNGVLQTPFKWAGKLQMTDSTVVPIGNVLMKTYSTAHLTAWLSEVNGRSDTRLHNDTIPFDTYVCGSDHVTNILIGNSNRADYSFHNIDTLLEHLSCGASGDICMRIESGTYNLGNKTFDLSAFSNILGKHRLIITSEAGHRDSVRITSNAAKCISLKNDSNITISHLTLTNLYGDVIYIEGKCYRINILHNHLIASNTSTSVSSGSAIYQKPIYQTDERIDLMNIVGNTIEGGYYGIYLCGNSYSTSVNGSGISVDSNRIYNQYFGAAYFETCGLTSVSYNTIRCRTTQAISDWWGIHLLNCSVANIVANHIKATHCMGEAKPRGICLSMGSDNWALIANNVIQLSTTGSTYGAYIYNFCTQFYNNTILLNGKGNADGIRYSDGKNIEIRNNMIITASHQSIIRIEADYEKTIRDYNNYYCGGKTWKMAAGQDAHSVSVSPVFIDSTKDLRMSNSYQFPCSRQNKVSKDVDGVIRNANTTMGAYHIPYTGISLDDFGKTLLTGGQNCRIEARLSNKGTDTLTSATIQWSINDVAQQPCVWKGSLAATETDTVTLGNYMVPYPASISIVAWLTDANNRTDIFIGNDTIRHQVYVCQGKLSGTYTVGDSVSTFPTLKEAFDALSTCGITGPVTLKMRSGKYGPMTINGNVPGASASNTITIMPDSGATVVLDGGDTKASFCLKNTEHWKFYGITFGNTTDGLIGMQLEGKLNDILFYDCTILASTTTTSSNSSAVRYPITSDNNDNSSSVNVRFIHNRIQGGCHNFYCYYTTVNSYPKKMSDIRIDSNVMSDAYAYGFYSNVHAQYKSISFNRISSRNTAATYYGIYHTRYSSMDRMEGNRLRLNNNGTTYGLFFDYAGTATDGLVCNNEIIAQGSGSKVGIYLTSPGKKWEVSHNSIFLQSNGSSAKGLWIFNDMWETPLNICNNLVVINDGYPYYTHKSLAYTNKTYVNSDYNNYVSLKGTVIGFDGNNAYHTMAAWQAATKQDAHSVSIVPIFVDSSKNLNLKNARLFTCPQSGNVKTDIGNFARQSPTVMGAYAYLPTDAALNGFEKTGMSGKHSYTVEVSLTNLGRNALDSVTLQWSANGNLQTPVQWKGRLQPSFDTVVSMGNIILTASTNLDIKVWIADVNGQPDINRSNDTIRMQTYAYANAYSGSYTVGNASSDFPTLRTAVDSLLRYGVCGSVFLKVCSGKYDSLDIQGKIPQADRFRTVTLMPDSGANVILDGGSTAAALTVRNTAHWIFKGLTLGNTTNGLTGVLIQEDLEDITFRDCDILASTSATETSYRAVSYPNTDGSKKYPVNVRFIHNNIRGGYYNFYLNYTAGSARAMVQASLQIDSNNLSDAYYYGIYNYYYSVTKSLCYNTITNRSNSYIFYGIYSYYYAWYDKIEGNRMNLTASGSTYGICLNYYSQKASYTASGKAYLVNNEIISSSKAGTQYGIQIYSPEGFWEVHHNSIYLKSGATKYGMTFYNSNNAYKINASRNLVICDNMSQVGNNYPLYIASATYGSANYGKREFNNLYSSTNVAYIGTAITNINDLQSTTGQDSGTLAISPSFIDRTVNLQLNDDMPLYCTRIADVMRDINGNRRTEATAIGAYKGNLEVSTETDLMVKKILSPESINDIACLKDYTSAEIVIWNQGLKKADFNISSLKISIDVSGALNFHHDTLIRKGTLDFMESDTLTLCTFPTLVSGTYHLRITLSHAEDKVRKNDTLNSALKISRITPPYAVDFSVEPEFVNRTRFGDVSWKVLQGSGNHPDIAPAFGTGCLAFDGYNQRGSYADAIFNSVNIKNCIRPVLKFEYAHNAGCNMPDMLFVMISPNGGDTLTEILRIATADSVTAWKEYTIDLTPYNKYDCLSIVFRAMSYGGSNQYIDRIRIMAETDMEISLLPIDLSLKKACDESPVEIKAVIRNRSLLDLELSNDTITLNVNGAVSQSNSYVFNKKMNGLESDTITLGQLDLSVNGHFFLEAYMKSLDDNAANDTVRDSTLYIMQDMALDSIFGTESMKNKQIGEQVNISAVAVNSGNISVDRMFFRLNLNGNDIVTDTVFSLVKPGDTLVHPMTYTIPGATREEAFYSFRLNVELACDGNTANDSIDGICEVCIPDMLDIQVLDITATSPAKGKTKVAPSIRIANIGNLAADSVLLHMDVLDSALQVLESLCECISRLDMNETRDCNFTKEYTVPNYTGQYTLKAYVEQYNGDTVQRNDTLSKAFANEVDDTRIRESEGLDWSMGQNIPNPANNVTRIPFRLPQDAEVVFSVMGANGQLIYREQISAGSGDNMIKFDVNGLANGIYYYSMEYQGQRIVRKMNVVR